MSHKNSLGLASIQQIPGILHVQSDLYHPRTFRPTDTRSRGKVVFQYIFLGWIATSIIVETWFSRAVRAQTRTSAVWVQISALSNLLNLCLHFFINNMVLIWSHTWLIELLWGVQIKNTRHLVTLTQNCPWHSSSPNKGEQVVSRSLLAHGGQPSS